MVYGLDVIRMMKLPVKIQGHVLMCRDFRVSE